MNAIVSVCADWGIGKDNKLLIANKADMKHFVAKTKGATVLMGRNTFESLPGGALKGRRNLVVSSNPNYKAPGAEVFQSFGAAKNALSTDEACWLIGGARMYHEHINECDFAYVTKHDCVRDADTFFPNLDTDPSWKVIEEIDGGTTNEGVPFTFVTYQHI